MFCRHFGLQAVPAHHHHAQGQLRPRGLHLQVWENHLAGQRRLRRPQRPADRELHLRNQRAERHRTEGQQTPVPPRAGHVTGPYAAVCCRCPQRCCFWAFQDSQIKDILSTSPTAMTITIMPKFVYEHMIKRYVRLLGSRRVVRTRLRGPPHRGTFIRTRRAKKLFGDFCVFLLYWLNLT